MNFYSSRVNDTYYINVVKNSLGIVGVTEITYMLPQNKKHNIVLLHGM